MDKIRQLEAQRTKLLETQSAEMRSLRERMNADKERDIRQLMQQHEADQRARQKQEQEARQAAEAELRRRVHEETKAAVEKIMKAEIEQAHRDTAAARAELDKVRPC
jgi:hypothetical protein